MDSGAGLQPAVRFRTAQDGDCRALFDWLIDPETRRWSARPASFDFDEHAAWFRASLLLADRIIVIAETDVPIGMVRFDRRATQALVSINLAPAARGKRLATHILVGAEALVADWRLDSLIAEIKPGNLPSIRAFQRAGYSKDVEHANGQMLRFVKELAPPGPTPKQPARISP